MKFSIDRTVLLQTLSKIQGIADKRGSVGNILSHILIESVDGDTLRLKCTDYDVVVIADFPANVDKGGAIAVNAKTFYDSIKLWQDNLVEIESIEGGNINCRCGKTAAMMNTFPPDDFPKIEKEDNEERVSLPAIVISDISSKMAPFMSDDPARMSLNGILLKVQNKKEGMVLTAVATDGHRMAVMEKVLPDIKAPFDQKQAIVHRKGIMEIKRLLDDSRGESASLGFAIGEVVVRTDDTALFIRQIDEEFPNYVGVIPGNFKGKLKVSKSDLVNAVRIASPIIDTHSQVVKISFKPGAVVVSGARSDFGNIETEILADYEGEAMEVGYNYKFLLDSLSKIDSFDIFWGINGTDFPSLMKPMDPEEKSLFIIMPMDIS